jgi:hypothetical protein
VLRVVRPPILVLGRVRIGRHSRFCPETLISILSLGKDMVRVSLARVVGKVVLSLDKVLVKVEVLVKGEVLVMVVGKVLLMFGTRMNITVLRIRVLQGILVIMEKVIDKGIVTRAR